MIILNVSLLSWINIPSSSPFQYSSFQCPSEWGLLYPDFSFLQYHVVTVMNKRAIQQNFIRNKQRNGSVSGKREHTTQGHLFSIKIASHHNPASTWAFCMQIRRSRHSWSSHRSLRHVSHRFFASLFQPLLLQQLLLLPLRLLLFFLDHLILLTIILFLVQFHLLPELSLLRLLPFLRSNPLQRTILLERDPLPIPRRASSSLPLLSTFFSFSHVFVLFLDQSQTFWNSYSISVPIQQPIPNMASSNSYFFTFNPTGSAPFFPTSPTATETLSQHLNLGFGNLRKTFVDGISVDSSAQQCDVFPVVPVSFVLCFYQWRSSYLGVYRRKMWYLWLKPKNQMPALMPKTSCETTVFKTVLCPSDSSHSIVQKYISTRCVCAPVQEAPMSSTKENAIRGEADSVRGT